MADKLWVGGTDGNFDTNANWSPANTPVDGDNLYFVNALGSNNACTGNCDRTASTVEYPLIFIGPDYDGNVGASGEYLTCAADLVSMNGRGTLYLAADDGDNPGTEWIDTVYQSAGTMVFDATDVGASPNVALVRISGGICTLESAGTYDEIHVNGQNAVVTIEAGLTNDSTVLSVDAGIVTCYMGFSTVNARGGQFIYAESATAVTLATLNVSGQAVVKDNSSNPITTVNLDGGTFDYSGNVAPGGQTITNIYWAGGRLNLDNGAGNLTLSNAIQVNASGLQFVPMINSTLTVASQ